MKTEGDTPLAASFALLWCCSCCPNSVHVLVWFRAAMLAASRTAIWDVTHPVTLMLLSCCCSHVVRYMVIETRKDGTKFTNRALKDAAERQADVSARYEQLQKDLVAQVRAVVYLETHIYHCVMYCSRRPCSLHFAHAYVWLSGTNQSLVGTTYNSTPQTQAG